MHIDRIKAEKVFNDYVENYDSSNEKIKLKIDHTYRVSKLCEEIAFALGMEKEEVDIAYLTGLLHDIGRFEQVKRYGTFNDINSVDHAKLGVEILFEEGKIRDFIEDPSEDVLIKNVIGCHNTYKIPEDFPKRTTVFSNILRDADKIDIFKVNIIAPIEEIYNVKKEEVYNSVVTQEVLDNLKRKDTVLRKLKKSAVDNIVGHISLIFGLVYDESIKIAVEQGYFEKLMEFKSENSITNKQFDEIRSFVNSYIKDKIEK